MSRTYYLITVNSNGTISYMAKGTYREMKKLEVNHFHKVTTISNYEKAKTRFGI